MPSVGCPRRAGAAARALAVRASPARRASHGSRQLLTLATALPISAPPCLPFSIIQPHLHRKYPFSSVLYCRYSPDLWELIKRLLAKSPAARPTMDEVMQMEMVRANGTPALPAQEQGSARLRHATSAAGALEHASPWHACRLLWGPTWRHPLGLPPLATPASTHRRTAADPAWLPARCPPAQPCDPAQPSRPAVAGSCPPAPAAC